MRNKYAGICYRCGKEVKPGDGHFERHQGQWRVQHANCAVIAKTSKVKAAESQRMEGE